MSTLSLILLPSRAVLGPEKSEGIGKRRIPNMPRFMIGSDADRGRHAKWGPEAWAWQFYFDF